jgi:hypothetical protein
MGMKTENERLKGQMSNFILGVTRAITFLPKTIVSKKMARRLIHLITSMGAGLIKVDLAKNKKEKTRQIKVTRKQAATTDFWVAMITDMRLFPGKVGKGLTHQCKEIADSLGKLIKK